MRQELYSERACGMKFVMRDVVLWLRHLEEAGVLVPSGCAALFRVGDRDILLSRCVPVRAADPRSAYERQ